MTVSEDRDGLRPFEPARRPLSMGQRIAWQFSRLGRAKLGLWRACRSPQEASAWQALDRRLPKLRRGRKKGNRNTDVVLCDLLIHLAWHSLQIGAVDASCRHLNELDEHQLDAAVLSPRVPLRWSTLERLLDADDLRAYVEQARRLVADPLVGRAEAAAVLKVIRIVYERVSPAECAAVLSAANDSLSRSAIVKTCLAVCQCPPRFASAKEAGSWASRVHPEHAGFSDCLKADALLIHARAAEWDGDWDLMERRAEESFEVAPGHLPAHYWLARARLHRPDRNPAGGLDVARWPDSVEWTRLRRQIDLYLSPGLDGVEATLPDLADTEGAGDPMERALMVRLLRSAFRVDPLWDDAQVDRAAGLGERLQAILGRQAWTQPAIALGEIRRERSYAVAIGRLEAEDVRAVAPAPELSRLARILAGSPTGDAEGRSECFEAIEAAMFRVLAGRKGAPGLRPATSEDDRALGASLGEIRHSPWCERFPALRATVDVLQWAMAMFLADEAFAAPAIEDPAPGHASPWMVWLRARVVLAGWIPTQTAELPAELDGEDPLVARSVLDRWMLYGHVSGDVPPAIARQRTLLEGQPADRDGFVETHGLGTLVGRLLKTESSLRAACLSHRKQLAEGDKGEAAAQWQSLLGDLAGLGLATAAWWAPAVSYWHGVALAHAGSPEAWDALAALVDGPKGLEARGQLALLAIQRGDPAAAERLLGDAPRLFPSIVYGQALLAHRRGDDASARTALERLEADFAGVPSPYHLAARRLSAAIAERQGDLATAEQLHRATLQGHAGDDVTSARLRRLLLNRAYAQVRAGGPLDPCRADELSADDAASIAWSRHHAMLRRALVCPGEELDAVRSAVVAQWSGSERACSWFQVVARRLLRAGRPDDARAVLDSTDFGAAPSWNRRSRLILRAWHLLAGAGASSMRSSPGGNHDPEGPGSSDAVCEVLEQIADCARRIEQFAGGGDDEPLRRWASLLGQATELGGGDGRQVPAEARGAAALWPVATVLRLWHESEEDRARAGQSLLDAVSSEDGRWSERQRQLVTAISSWAAGRHEAFLDVFSELEAVLGELPVHGPSLWVAAASLWFQKGDWGRILDGALPDCVADLTDTRARLLIGLAYARSAADDSLKRQLRSALRRIDQAQGTLDDLLEPSELQESSALAEPQRVGEA